jgi:hypothetical protein
MMALAVPAVLRGDPAVRVAPVVPVDLMTWAVRVVPAGQAVGALVR